MATRDEKQQTKKIDMAQHEYKVKSLGISDRARKLIIRSLIVGTTLILLVYWITKAMQQ